MQIFNDSLASSELAFDGLTSDDLQELLLNDDDVIDAEPRKTIVGYPTRPLYREVGSLLAAWAESG